VPNTDDKYGRKDSAERSNLPVIAQMLPLSNYVIHERCLLFNVETPEHIASIYVSTLR
jgi:hypothetical protein